MKTVHTLCNFFFPRINSDILKVGQYFSTNLEKSAQTMPPADIIGAQNVTLCSNIGWLSFKAAKVKKKFSSKMPVNFLSENISWNPCQPEIPGWGPIHTGRVHKEQRKSFGVACVQVQCVLLFTSTGFFRLLSLCVHVQWIRPKRAKFSAVSKQSPQQCVSFFLHCGDKVLKLPSTNWHWYVLTF